MRRILITRGRLLRVVSDGMDRPAGIEERARDLLANFPVLSECRLGWVAGLHVRFKRGRSAMPSDGWTKGRGAVRVVRDRDNISVGPRYGSLMNARVRRGTLEMSEGGPSCTTFVTCSFSSLQ